MVATTRCYEDTISVGEYGVATVCVPIKYECIMRRVES